MGARRRPIVVLALLGAVATLALWAQPRGGTPLEEPFRGVTTDGEVVEGLYALEATGVSTAPIAAVRLDRRKQPLIMSYPFRPPMPDRVVVRLLTAVLEEQRPFRERMTQVAEHRLQIEFFGVGADVVNAGYVKLGELLDGLQEDNDDGDVVRGSVVLGQVHQVVAYLRKVV